MEVITVSPSPASPTEGDDLCETDVSNVAIHSVTLLICLCGLAENGAVLRILSLESRNSGTFNLAFADILFLLFTVPSTFVFLVEDLSCSLIIPLTYLSFLFQLSMVSFYWALVQLTFFSFRKDMTFFYQLYCCYKVPERLWWVVDSSQDLAYFALFTIIPMVTSLCPSNEKDHCRAALISMCTIILLLFVDPMVISPTIDIIRAWCGSKKQHPKRRDVIIFITVDFALLLNLCNFLQQLGYFPLSSQVVFLLTCIHSSIKPFIYFLAGNCWRPLRLSLQRVFEEKKENTAGIDDPAMEAVL